MLVGYPSVRFHTDVLHTSKLDEHPETVIDKPLGAFTHMFLSGNHSGSG